MRKTLITIAMIVAFTAIGGAIYVAKHGWDATTMYGRDPMAVVAYGFGGGAVPLTLAAGASFLGGRTNYFNRWIIISLALGAIIFGLNLVVALNPR